VKKYAELVQKCKDDSIDLKTEREVKRMLHEQAENWERKYEDLKRCVVREFKFVSKGIMLIESIRTRVPSFWC
jgi:predicted transcriptional regulator